MPPFSSLAVPVLRDLRTLPVGHPQSAAELGLLPTSPNPTPLTSDDEDEGVSHIARTVQEIVSVNFGSTMMSIAALIMKDDPIVLDATTTVPSHTTNVIDTVWNSRQQKECGTR
ncbi:hypothetical protein AtubIFM55763_002751, partial [Aspergillus tubingensis]